MNFSSRITRTLFERAIIVLFLGLSFAGHAAARAHSDSFEGPTIEDSTWIQLTPTGGPPDPRGFHGMSTVYDPANNRMMVFGGRLSNNNNSNDLWVLTIANGIGGTGQWLNFIPDGTPGSPPSRSGHTAVYDAASNRMVIFGGCNGYCLPALNDVWVLSNANGVGGTPTWIQLFPAGGPPPPRTRHTAVYDPTTNRMIVFAGQDGGGFGCSTFSEVWVLSNANGLGGTPIWSQLSPTGGPPAGQYAPSAVYDPANNRMTVFGGGGFVNGTCQGSNAVWVLTNANGVGGTPSWINVSTEGNSGSPVGRGFHSAVYDAACNQMIMFGGDDSLGVNLNDAWGLGNANGIGGAAAWTQLAPTGGPPPARSSHGAVFDPGTERMIIFGGDDNTGFLNDTWLLTLSSTVSFNVCPLFDQTKAYKSGSTLPVKLQLCDVNGNDVSSSTIDVRAVSLIMVSTNAPANLADAGNANPDSNFRFDETLGDTGGYIFNLSLKVLASGTYLLNFTAGTDPTVHSVTFQVK